MAEPLRAADFSIAFLHGRAEPVACRNAAGALLTVPADQPAFDHSADGAPLGLLVSPGEDLGGGDRTTIDPLILPADLVSGDAPGARDATVFHRFDDGSGEQRRAWYTRNAAATIDALLSQPGHHLEIGVVPGLRPNSGQPGTAGFVHYRGAVWLLPELVEAGVGVLAEDGRPVLRAGAEG